MTLAFAESTERFTRQFSHNPPHATLITGPIGIGLLTLSEHLARLSGTILAVIKPESKTSGSIPSIQVERIRQLYVQTRTRLDGHHFIIIDDAETMNHAAQNALLKLLEEPNESIHFILTSHAPERLLPTIRSRSQVQSISPISSSQSRKLLEDMRVTDKLTLQRLLFVAEGLPAELTRFAENAADFQKLAERVQLARQFAEGNTYSRLSLVQTLKDDRPSTIAMIEVTVMLLRKSLATKPDRPTIVLIDRLLSAVDAIRANGNVRLHLSDAVLY